MMMRSALYQTNTLSWIFIVLVHCNNSPQINMSHYSDTLSGGNQSFSFMLRIQRRSNKYQCCSLWLDPIGARTHDIPHQRRACYPLHHRCGCLFKKNIYKGQYLTYSYSRFNYRENNAMFIMLPFTNNWLWWRLQ